MAESAITIDQVYLDGRVIDVLTNAVSTLEANDAVVSADNGLVSVNERWDRAKQSWTLSWGPHSLTIKRLFKVNRTARGFLFVSPVDDERIAIGQLLRNTVTGLNVGDGSTTTFQLQIIDSTSASSVTMDVNYPLYGSQTDIEGNSFSTSLTAYNDGVSVPVSAVNLTTGVLTFTTAPGVGVIPTADFQYAWPAKFTSKTISTTWMTREVFQVRSAQIEEIF